MYPLSLYSSESQWGNLSCDADLCLDIEDNKIIYNTKKTIHGLKIKHAGCLGSIISGAVQNYEFKIDKTNKVFDAELVRGSTPIPSGTGVLVEFDIPFNQNCMTEIIFYEDGGWVLSYNFNPILGCMDETSCNFNARANKDDESCEYPPKHYDCVGNCMSGFDCFDKCGGKASIDECDICGGDNSTCSDCAGVPNGDNKLDNCSNCDNNISNDCIQDCMGTWGGKLEIDDCGICGGGNSSCSDQCGVPNGDNTTCSDQCGIPNGDNSTCADCAGVPNGDNELDNCGNCDNTSSNDCIQDCAGTWGGDLADDQCGVCGGNNSTCSDCHDTPNGLAFLDDCSICSSGTTNHIANSDKDCFGVCFGKSKLDCANICDGDKKIDCLGICDGENKEDRCGVCNGDNNSCGATYLWPTDASKTVTAFFAEERPHRYHAGLDIRTYGKIGDNLFATSDGYIKKITVNTNKYGKALYLQLDDGNVALYAHLNNFTKEIDDIVRNLQKKNNKYSLHYIFEPNEFRFSKGDIIGYAGDTGSLSGPHLHYELRDSTGKPFNPLHEYNITDNKSPLANNIAFIPREFNGNINGLNKPQVFNLSRLSSNIYELTDTIAIDGKFGLAIDVIDKVDSQPFSYGVYKLELYVDDNKTYEVSYDIYNYYDAKYIYNERDYQLKIDTGDTFYRLFSDMNKDMLFINNKYSEPYILFDDNGYHDFKIIISDFNNNKIHVSGTILNKKLPILETTLHDNNSIIFNNILEENHDYTFSITGKHDLDKMIPSDNTSIKNNIINYEHTNKPFSVLKIDIKSNDGTQYLPQYISIIEDAISHINGKFILKHYQHGVIIEFQTEEFTPENPYLTYIEDGYRKTINMHRVSKNSFETKLLQIVDFDDYHSLEINFNTRPIHIFKHTISKKLVQPDKKFKLLHNNAQTIINGDPYTFSDSTIIWVEKSGTVEKGNSNVITEPISIGPNRIKFNKPINLTVRLSNREQLDQSSIYKLNTRSNTWDYISSTINNKEISLTANINSGGIYAVIKETQSPFITKVYPGDGGSYHQNDFKEIRFKLTDDESGIKNENSITVQIDQEKPIIFEYNTYRNEVFYKLDNKLSIGEHTLKISAIDNVGNKTYKENQFYIKNK